MNSYLKIGQLGILLSFAFACTPKDGHKQAVGSNSTKDSTLPAKENIAAIFDEMDTQQATQTYLWGLPIVAFAEWKHIHEDVFGAKSGDLVIYSSYKDRLGILTGNATTPYIMGFIDLAKDGPVVIEMPPGHTAGGLADFWQRELAAIGEMGADKGKGGKYILIPPGQKDFKAPGYYILPCSTMNVFFGFRALDPDPKKAEELVHDVKIYPYSKKASPPASQIVTPAGKEFFGIQPKGIAYWKRLHAIIQEEPVEERDRFFMAWLNNLGISKGNPFNPDERQQKILIEASAKGESMAQVNSFAKRFSDVHHWPDRRWDYVMIIPDPSQRATNYDYFFERSSYFYEAVTYSKAMITKTLNVGQAYLGSYVDIDGNWLDGGKNYKLKISANPPALNFWSINVYDAATRCLINNEQQNADLSSRKDLIKNEDGSFDLYFGPEAPEGFEKNWVQTNPGKQWFTYLRLYAPTEAYFDKSWKLDDIELAK